SLIPGVPLPVELTSARAGFETAWLNSGMPERLAAEQAELARALAMTVRSYRFQEDGNPERPGSLRWSDEMIGFAREAGDQHALVEAMLEKGAIFLELSQLNQLDPARVEQISRDGDRLLQNCFSIAQEDQRTEVLRYW